MINDNLKCRLWIVVLAAFFVFQSAFGQNNRLNTTNTIGWYGYFGTLKVSNRIGLHAEYQWRRNHLITAWQQGLLRLGINYHINPRVLVRAGYAWIETFPYGAYPLQASGRDFTEHRFFEMIQLSHREGIVEVSHRFMLEQRFVGRYSTASAQLEDEFPLLHRMRYMIRIQLPLHGTEIRDNTPYLALYDEILVGFGKNVNANIFDQNRIGAILGYRFNKNVRIEAGFVNQILQYGRQIDGKNVFQNNSGLLVNAAVNLDCSKIRAK